jgi:hypothetical protein
MKGDRCSNWGIVAVVLLMCLIPVRGFAQQAPSAEKEAAAKPTPRLTNGHPDLSGFYLVDSESNEKALTGQPKPSYKSDAIAKVSGLEKDKSKLDPVVNCLPAGVPRVGAPSQIVESPVLTVFLYGGKSGHYSRLIPTDGRPHRDDLDPSYYGDSIGHWDGDALVVDTNGLDDSTWLGPNGWLHSDETHVIERFTRQGNVLKYEVRVEDPKVFAKPWVLRPRTVLVNTDPDSFVYKDPVCNGKDY